MSHKTLAIMNIHGVLTSTGTVPGFYMLYPTESSRHASPAGESCSHPWLTDGQTDRRRRQRAQPGLQAVLLLAPSCLPARPLAHPVLTRPLQECPHTLRLRCLELHLRNLQRDKQARLTARDRQCAAVSQRCVWREACSVNSHL